MLRGAMYHIKKVEEEYRAYRKGKRQQNNKYMTDMDEI